MKEYFISEINIEKLYHLSNITIELDTTKRQHLLLTGKNGSGKTSLLLRLVRYLKVLKDVPRISVTCRRSDDISPVNTIAGEPLHCILARPCHHFII